MNFKHLTRGCRVGVSWHNIRILIEMQLDLLMDLGVQAQGYDH
jgi:hypothetical protein